MDIDNLTNLATVWIERSETAHDRAYKMGNQSVADMLFTESSVYDLCADELRRAIKEGNTE